MNSHRGYMSTGMNTVAHVMFYVIDFSLPILTLILLNKLSLPHPFLTVSQSDNSMLFVPVNLQTEWQNSVEPDQMASSEAIWSGSTLFSKGHTYPGSAGQGLNAVILVSALASLSLFPLHSLWASHLYILIEVFRDSNVLKAWMKFVDTKKDWRYWSKLFSLYASPFSDPEVKVKGYDSLYKNFNTDGEQTYDRPINA